MTRAVIVTGDDFGLAVPVNEAVEQAHREGVLTTATLLVGEPASADAVARARRLPELRVGLHVAVCEGRPVLPRRAIPALVDGRGELRRPVAAFVGFLLRPGVARQIEAEIRAQFAAFAATGLVLDHVSGHNNMQLHPVVLPVLMRVAREYGARAIRLPYEPLGPSWRATRRGLARRFLSWLAMAPWDAYVRRRLVRAGFRVNDYAFGIYDSGRLDVDALVGFIRNLPEGVSEIFCHPATRRCAEIDRTMPAYGHERELHALVSREVRDALAASGVRTLAGFGALAAPPRASAGTA